jgi:two-component SAPR family response regulator
MISSQKTGGGTVLNRVLLTDIDKDNTEWLIHIFNEYYHLTPQVWQSERAFQTFIRAPEDGVVFVRIDDPSIPGLELTRQATARYPKIQLVWMAANDGYAIEAFLRGIDAYLLLPATEDKLKEVMDSLIFKKVRYGEK